MTAVGPQPQPAQQHYANPSGDIGVIMPSGSWQPVMNYAEQRYLEDHVQLYAEHNQLSNISDLMELDRLLVMELVAHRVGVWVGAGRDYDGEPVVAAKLQEQLGSLSTEVRLVKKNLGLDRPARERAKGEGSIAHYWEALQVRAKAFGVLRNQQSNKNIELGNELIMQVDLHDNCADDAEREKLHCTLPEIFAWVRGVYKPEFQAIDAHFRANAQSTWIRSQ